LLLGVAILAGCTPTAPNAGAGVTTAPATTPTTGAPTTPAAAGHTYRSVDNLCTVVDWKPLQQLYSHLDAPSHMKADGGAMMMLRCYTSLNRPGDSLDGVVVQFAAFVFKSPDLAKTDFDMQRQLATGEGQVYAFAAAGTDGFRQLDRALGNTVTIIDGNLELRTVWDSLPGAKVPDLSDQITQIITTIMTGLQQS
jgi:hypothetical protein